MTEEAGFPLVRNWRCGVRPCEINQLRDSHGECVRAGSYGFELESSSRIWWKRETCREKMISSILLLVVLTDSVCGTLVVNVSQTSYHAEENSNITMEWIFTPSIPLTDLHIDCALWLSDLKTLKTLYHLQKGVEHPEFQDEQFAGRVRCDKDELRQGHIRLHLSRLSVEDSGVCQCEVFNGHDGGVSECSLSVSAGKHLPEDPGQGGDGGIILIGAVGGALIAVIAAVALIVKRSHVVELVRRVCGPTEQGSDQQENENLKTITGSTNKAAADCSNILHNKTTSLPH